MSVQSFYEKASFGWILFPDFLAIFSRYVLQLTEALEFFTKTWFKIKMSYWHISHKIFELVCLFVCFYGRPPEGRKVGVPIRDSASRPGLALVTPPSRHWTWEQDKHSYLLGQFKSLHHNNSCNWIPLIARNLAGWTFVCPRRNLVHPAPENSHDILTVLRYSADPLKAVSNLRLVPYPQAILKIRPTSSLDYRARHGPQTDGVLFCYLFV